ncbi:MAG: carbohydrate-binding family 9-like protein, partial [Armatimonadota bacterium]|nr:carbohydrate-binding family 9-like protein [Armatimonadota bacterium]
MRLRNFILKSFALVFLIIAVLGLLSANAEETIAPTQLLTIPRLVEAPTIDGRIGNVEWARAGKIPYMLLLRTWREPTQNTQVYVCYTDSALYVAFDCSEEKMPKVAGEPGERDGDIFHADCVEVFIQPEDGKLPYYHFGVGISGTVYDAKKITPAQTDSSWNADWRAAVSRRSNGWSAEIEIPFAIFGVVPKPGTYWKVNFTRESRTSAEFSSWSPVRAGFHEPESFGTLVFDTEVPIVNIRQFVASPNGVVERDGEVANPAAMPIEVRMETYLAEAHRKTTQGITIQIEPKSTQKFRLVDEFRNEGQLTAVLEAKIKGKSFYRLLRPYYVPPIRTKLAEISARLRILESRLRKMPKDTS